MGSGSGGWGGEQLQVLYTADSITLAKYYSLTCFFSRAECLPSAVGFKEQLMAALKHDSWPLTPF